LFQLFATGVIDAGGKFATGVNDTGSKFAAGGNDTGGNLPPVSTTPAANFCKAYTGKLFKECTSYLTPDKSICQNRCSSILNNYRLYKLFKNMYNKNMYNKKVAGTGKN